MQFSYPLRPWPRFYSAAGFLDPEYFKERGRWHRGVDLNLLTGGDSDLGYPVCSVFPGTVVYAERPGSWGGVVVVRADEWVRRYVSDRLERPLGVLDVQYAHLLHLTVAQGDVLNAGECVGSVGKGAHNQYAAHLHLELRTSEFDPALPQGADEADRKFCLYHCLDPLAALPRLCSDEPNTLAQKAYLVPTRVLGVVHHGEGAALVHPVGDKLYLEGC